ncbi:mechanosensitive ion channel domain-containing protein [Pleionea sediminis]|uniref:mechanosensitive ion channel domain-containing protein n=1 Tax=Pleionea sediminis TaxID=2569479 RepID=UPI001186E8BD|nr:mechanosensitive ion channel domain-containing protein [Pleionea sediminis]
MNDIVRHLKRSFYFFFLLQIALVTSPLLAEKEMPQPVALDFVTFDNHWWTGWRDLTKQQKTEWLEKIEVGYQEAIQKIPKTNQTLEKINSTLNLIQSLHKLLEFEKSAIKVDEYNEFTLSEWLEFYKSSKRLSDSAKRLEAEIKQRVEAIEALKEELNALVVQHRQLKAFSDKSVNNILSAYASQLNLIYLQQKQNIAQKQLGDTKVALKATMSRLENNIELLSSTAVFEKQQNVKKVKLQQQLSRIKQIMGVLQRQTWSSLNGEKEVVYQLSYHEEKLKKAIIEAEQLSIDVLLTISKLLQEKEVPQNIFWHEDVKTLKGDYELLTSQFSAYREQVIASGEAANEMVFEKTQRSVWQYLESNQKLTNQFKAQLDEVEFFILAYRQFLSLKKGWTSEVDLGWKLWSTKAKSRWESFLNFTIFTINDYPVTLSDLISAIIVLMFAIIISSLLKRLLRRIGRKRAISESTLFNVARVLHYVIIATAILIALSILGIDSSKIALVAGALSVGIGFGLQAIFNNFVSGLILLFERPLRVGDLVELESGVRGRIKAINVRSTQLKTRDNIDLLVPNSEFVNFKVINYTFSDPLRRIHIPFRTSLDSDKEYVKEIVIKTAMNISYTQKNKQHTPELWLKRIGEFSLEFELIVWVNANKLHDNDGIECQYLWEVDSALREAGIEIPVPKQTITLNDNKHYKEKDR